MTGQTISHYRILEKLGEGGMGVVYKAEDSKLRRVVALKFLPPTDDGAARERFLREARAAAALNHPNICTIYEVDEEHGFLAMECVEGVELKARIAERPLPLNEALDIAIQTAQGLETAHQKGIRHRDIKPANIMIDTQGRVKIMDFGLAQVDDASRLTQTGWAAGTPAYMSPEQAMGRPIDRRSDLYSLGVVLYEMLTGRLPALDEPEPVTALRSGIPKDLDRIVAKAVAKDPGERYQNAADLAGDLRQLVPSPASKRTAPSRRTVLAASLVGVAAAGAGSWWYARARAPARRLIAGAIPSKNPEANEYFEKAVFYLRPQFDLMKGRTMLERAISIDPEFTAARAFYAFTHFLMIESGVSNDPAWLYRAEQEAKQVLAVNPNQSQAHNALAAAYLCQGRKELAAKHAELAVGLNNLGTHIFLARLQLFDGRFADASASLRAILEREPLFFPGRVSLGDILRQQGDYEGALRELEKVLDQDSQNFGALVGQAFTYLDLNQPARSRESLERMRPDSRKSYGTRLVWAMQCAAEGKRAEALRELDPEVLKYAEFLTWTSWAAEVFAVLGEKEKALEWLDRAVRTGDNRAAWFERDPMLANIRNEPRFRQLMDVIKQRAPSGP